MLALIVTAAILTTPSISLSETTLSFEGTAEGPNPSPKTVTLSNSGGGTLGWTATSTADWLEVTPESSQLTAGASTTLTIAIDSLGLASASYTGSVTVGGSGGVSPKTIAVTLTLSPAAGSSPMTVTPTDVNFEAIAGGTAPPPQIAMILNNTSGTLNWAATETASWLGVTPSSGQIAEDESAFLTIDATAAGLAPGTHTTAIAVIASSTTQSVSVTFTVYPPGTNLPPIAPAALTQSKADGMTPLLEGATSNQTVVILSAEISDPDAHMVVLEVEVKAADTPFDGTNLLIGPLISSGDTAMVTATGLTNGPYHWRCRARDEKDAPGPWKEFETAGNTDFTIDTSTNLPPLFLGKAGQFDANDAPLSEGAAVSGEVCFKAIPMDPDLADKVRLQVEVKPLDKLFDGIGLLESPQVVPSLEATAKAKDLAKGTYHWRYRVTDQSGLSSNWAEFGQLDSADFTVQATALSPTNTASGPIFGPKKKKRCGLLGGEAIALWALLAFLKKRRIQG